MSARVIYLLFTHGTELTRANNALSDTWYKGWRALAIALAISCVGVEVHMSFCFWCIETSLIWYALLIFRL